jgi:hypothetical protein
VLPLTVPMNGLTPQLDKAGDAGAKLELPGPAVAQNVTLAGSEGKPPKDIGPVGVRDLVVTATVPVSSLGAGGAPKAAKADFSGTLLGDNNQVVGTIKGGGQATLAAGSPSGPLKGTLSLELLNTPKIDALLDKPGFVSGAVGDRLKVDADAEVVLASADAGHGRAEDGTPVAPAPSALRGLSANVSIASPRLNTTQPLVLVSKDNIASLEKPSVLAWKVDPAWANAFLKPAATPGQPAPRALVSVTEPVDVTVSLTKLNLALGGGGIMKPGVFAADAQIAAPAPKLLVSGVPTAVKNVVVRAASGQQPNVLGFSLRVDDLGAGPAPGGGPAVDFAGGLYGIADAQGNPTLGAAKLSATGKAVNVPTAIIDAVTSQGGLLVDALGPTVSLTAEAKGASETGGQITAKATSERATADVSGTIKNGTFINDAPVDATLSVITAELGKRLTKGLPALGQFEKTKSDAPAVVTASSLTVPLDGNLAKLNGTIHFDPGEARFTTSTVFGKLLKIISQKNEGVVGRKLQPLDVTIKNGVLSYDRYSIPLGEFTLQTKGTVDLVQKKLDVITYVPLGSLTDEAAGVFNSGLGSALGRLPGLDKATMVPIRTSGSFENPQTKPDLELFVKETGSNLLKPGQAVGEGLQDLLKGIGQPKQKPKK